MVVVRMINRIISLTFLLCLFIALPLALLGIEHVELGVEFRAFMTQCSMQLNDFKIEIPNIPMIEYLHEDNFWLTILNAFIAFVNGLSTIINVIITILNVIIQIIQFIIIVVSNLVNMVNNLENQGSSSSSEFSEVIESITSSWHYDSTFGPE